MFKKIKRQLGIKLINSQMYKFLVLINMFMFHYDGREHKRSFGNQNKQLIFYVIRPYGKTEGLLSCVLRVVRELEYAERKGWIPIVDYKNYENQYRLGHVNNTENSWEYFFEQVSEYSLDEVYKSKNVVMSGWTCRGILQKKKDLSFEEEVGGYAGQIDNIKVKEYILEYAERQYEKFIDSNTLGVFCRGTDYVALKPKGHFKQPTIENLFAKVDEYIEKYTIGSVFLVTEDIDIECKFVDRYGNRVKILNKSIWKNYDGKDYLSDYVNKEQLLSNTVDYLVKILLLMRCEHIVSSITNATKYIYAKRKITTADYLFNIGKY